MKSILCYGDSNTYGFNPVNTFRYPKNIRWTGCLQEMLGEEYLVIEEGCNGRTTVFEDPIDPWKTGLAYLKPCLNTHKPVDIVVMMLGTNDLKSKFHASAETIAKGAERLVQEIYDFADSKQAFRPEIILVSPPVIGKCMEQSPYGDEFDETALTRSMDFEKWYREVAKRNDCVFFNAADYVTSCDVDSLHLMPEEHKKLAQALSRFILDEVSKRVYMKTKRLLMRPYNMQEMITLQENEQDTEMKKAYGDMIACAKENPGKEYWGAAWEIALHDGTRVGDLCFKGAPDENGAVEIGYGIDTPMQGNGYASEMVAAMIHWALVQSDVKMVIAETDEKNIASQKVLLKNGFVEDGCGKEGPKFVFRGFM